MRKGRRGEPPYAHRGTSRRSRPAGSSWSSGYRRPEEGSKPGGPEAKSLEVPWRPEDRGCARSGPAARGPGPSRPGATGAAAASAARWAGAAAAHWSEKRESCRSLSACVRSLPPLDFKGAPSRRVLGPPPAPEGKFEVVGCKVRRGRLGSGSGEVLAVGERARPSGLHPPLSSGP
ncbi:unnamed protein product [Rangifer tarandus platyrhynchus]|uniref:Uncharacterized protein n=1 Tax=Rangifer tarandus platyrhynchus TaxID=3082113 RepID=A0AC59ZF12_RANTA